MEKRAGLIAFFSSAFAGEEDEEVRLRKVMLLFYSILISLLAVLWGTIYWVFGEPLAAAIPLSYSLLSWCSIGLFLLTHRYGFWRTSQLLLSLFLPFALLVVLGGLVSSSAVVLWSLISAVGALLFPGRRQPWLWFSGYLVLVVASGLVELFTPWSNQLPAGLVTGFFVMNIAGVSTVAFVLLQYFIKQRELAGRLLRVEQEKSERLLLNVLPKRIAPLLKEGQQRIAERFDEASVLFADLVGFTPLSAKIPPAQMVELLNAYFSRFDELADRYGVEKIRTVGDSYMAASGVPVPQPDHAKRLARLALEMCRYIESRPLDKGQPIRFRIGINSGPLVGGVIGHQRFHYDVWGDTVNVASRMESQGVAGRIQIAESTYELLRGEFRCVPRGVLQVKGRGKLRTWFLEAAL
jgi:adenylate cyclase